MNSHITRKQTPTPRLETKKTRPRGVFSFFSCRHGIQTEREMICKPRRGACGEVDAQRKPAETVLQRLPYLRRHNGHFYLTVPNNPVVTFHELTGGHGAGIRWRYEGTHYCSVRPREQPGPRHGMWRLSALCVGIQPKRANSGHTDYYTVVRPPSFRR